MGIFLAPKASNLISRGILTMITGGVLTFVPGLTMKTVVIIVGISVLVSGALTFLLSFRKKSAGLQGFWIAQSLFNIAIGAVLVIIPDAMVNIFIVIIGIILLIFGGLQLVGAIAAMSRQGWPWFLFISAFIMIGGGLFMLSNPFKTAEAILTVLGVILMLYGVSELFSAWKICRRPKTIDGQVVEDVKYEEM